MSPGKVEDREDRVAWANLKGSGRLRVTRVASGHWQLPRGTDWGRGNAALVSVVDDGVVGLHRTGVHPGKRFSS